MGLGLILEIYVDCLSYFNNIDLSPPDTPISEGDGLHVRKVL